MEVDLTEQKDNRYTTIPSSFQLQKKYPTSWFFLEEVCKLSRYPEALLEEIENHLIPYTNLILSLIDYEEHYSSSDEYTPIQVNITSYVFTYNLNRTAF